VPELPEVETVVRSLAGELVGRRIVAVTLRERRLRGGVAADFGARLRGRRIVRLDRRGKYLLARLDDGAVWLVHLGMTGNLTLAPASRPDRVHDHVVITLDDGRLLTFNDARRFGRVAVVAA
jgi:formamidopyrimidine-DNA glycosylase